MTNTESINNIGTILVVGDWFIDEYWFISRHHSDVSSHTGPLHYRIVSETTDPVRDLCGAGLVARVLYELRRYNTDGIDQKIKSAANGLAQLPNDDEAKREVLEVLKKRVEDICRGRDEGQEGYTLQEIRLLDDAIRRGFAGREGLVQLGGF